MTRRRLIIEVSVSYADPVLEELDQAGLSSFITLARNSRVRAARRRRRKAALRMPSKIDTMTPKTEAALERLVADEKRRTS